MTTATRTEVYDRKWWLGHEHPKDLLTYLRQGPAAKADGWERKCRLAAVAVARLSWGVMSKAGREAVRAAEQSAQGLLEWGELRERSRAADLEWDDYMGKSVSPQFIAAADAYLAAGGDPVRAAMDVCVSQHHWKAAPALREVMGDPFAPAACPDAWRTPAVGQLAQVAYAGRRDDGSLDPLTLAALADALEEAGAPDGDLLRHLRGREVCLDCMLPSPETAEYGGGNYWCPGCGGTEERGHGNEGWAELKAPHFLGCWAVELVLGKA